MRTVRFLDRIRAELEAPTEQRMFGSGWIAGSLGILAGLVGLAMVIILRNPQLTTVPELAIINKSALFRPALYFILIAGFSLAALSLVLRKDKTLGTTAMIATLAATMIGSLPSNHHIKIEGVFFGLDFFVLNVLFVGLLFIPIERIFAKNKDQSVFRDEWREDIFYYLVSSLFVQILTYLTLAPSTMSPITTTSARSAPGRGICLGWCSSSRSCC